MLRKVWRMAGTKFSKYNSIPAIHPAAAFLPPVGREWIPVSGDSGGQGTMPRFICEPGRQIESPSCGCRTPLHWLYLLRHFIKPSMLVKCRDVQGNFEEFAIFQFLVMISWSKEIELYETARTTGSFIWIFLNIRCMPKEVFATWV